MNFKELLEGAEPKMPGAPSGIKIMTPQQFVASAGDSKSDDEEELKEFAPYDHNDSDDDFDGEEDDEELRSLYDTKAELEAELDYAEDDEEREQLESDLEDVHARIQQIKPDAILEQGVAEEKLNELDMFAPVTTFIKMTDGSYVQADWRRGQGNAGFSDSASFINFKPVNPTVAKQLGLDSNQSNNSISNHRTGTIASGGDYQSSSPISSRRYEVVDYNKPETMEKLPDEIKPELIKWIQKQGVAEGSLKEFAPGGNGGESGRWYTDDEMTDIVGDGWWQDMDVSGANIGVIDSEVPKEYMIQEAQAWLDDQGYSVQVLNCKVNDDDMEWYIEGSFQNSGFAKKGMAESQEHLDRIRKLSGLGEATKLPASTRDLGGQEFQDYMKRIVGTPDVDKAGNVKVDKKGNEKYVSGKTKGDKYKMPYIHRSSVVTYMSPDGQTFDEDAVKKTLAIRPKSLLKQNEKMKHSNGEFEQFFNVGFAALVGIALDEQTNNLIVVNTCPGAGSCKVDCFAMKGGKIQFKAAWQSDGRILTYLLNDPDGFFNQLSSEISKEASAGAKGDKKFPKGWQTTIRWHDAGDFFSPEYLDMALKMAAKHPDVRFYAYTKMAGAALAQKPDNFIINWSEGAHTSQEKQVKAKDANLDTTKNSRIVPDDLFQDLLVKDQKGNLVKGEAGQWQVQPNKLPELKQRLAKEYGISANSILSYDEYMAKRKSIPAGMKYNVIVAPGEGDISANDPNIVSTLLLRH